MFEFISRWRTRRILERHPVSESAWQTALARCRPAQRLAASDQAGLRLLVTLLLHEKSVEPVQGLKLDETDRIVLATHACLPILHLGLRWYRDWHALVIYPDLFIPSRTSVDAAGVVHHQRHPLQGEAWGRGPVILSWQSVVEAGNPHGHNVVIHEMAHKLDLLNGEANGFPPLHARMSRRTWSRVFSTAFREMSQRWRQGEALPMDPYGLESPGEFFAVASEAFFEAPRHLLATLPEVYGQLALFYRQRPAGD